MKELLAANTVFCVMHWVWCLKCPSPGPEWAYRASEVCTSSIRDYHCLEVSHLSGQFLELCLKPVQLEKGTRPVFNINVIARLDAIPCPKNRYQNVSYFSNKAEAVNCPFEKKKCTSIGQITVELNSTTMDNECSCNQKEGYILFPKNCNLWWENCTCYRNATTPITQNNNGVESDNAVTIILKVMTVVGMLIFMIVLIGCIGRHRKRTLPKIIDDKKNRNTIYSDEDEIDLKENTENIEITIKEVQETCSEREEKPMVVPSKPDIIIQDDIEMTSSFGPTPIQGKQFD